MTDDGWSMRAGASRRLALALLGARAAPVGALRLDAEPVPQPFPMPARAAAGAGAAAARRPVGAAAGGRAAAAPSRAAHRVAAAPPRRATRWSARRSRCAARPIATAAPTRAASTAAASRSTCSRSTAIALPRDVRDQFSEGKPVDADELAPGDLIFFTTDRARARRTSAIAIGGDEFVHAPSSTGVVRVERLSSSYWSPRFVGARRVELAVGIRTDAAALTPL